MPGWLSNAVFYEVYPQSFNDTNGDGIGDIPGITQKLDYILKLGCNAIWLNPCFDSPFKDAGYDVRDYKKVAPRYGTNEDLIRLFGEAHARGMHVILDLVAGHTSEEHEWFRQSGKAQPNEYSGRYVWSDFWLSDMDGRPFIAGECERNGVYMLNFFKCQPALNYGFLEPKKPWQMAMDSPDALATREALKDVIRFWLQAGADGFRVDMANSLVKGDDEHKSGTCQVWQDIRSMLDEEFPEAALVSEWSDPIQAINGGGFHVDFYLDHPDNGYHSLMREGEKSYFAVNGQTAEHFLSEYLPRYEATRENGYVSLITCNHDTPRASWTLKERELKLAYAFILTMPGVPFIYYGDEIGMRYLADLPTKEGGYTRTGTRTPMQWDHTRNMGFSDADADQLYLPQDPAEDAPTAEAAMADPESIYAVVKQVAALRAQTPDLQADEKLEILHDGCGEDRVLIYRRGAHVMAVNPSDREQTVAAAGSTAGKEPVWVLGKSRMTEDGLQIGAQSFAVYEMPG